MQDEEKMARLGRAFEGFGLPGFDMAALMGGGGAAVGALCLFLRIAWLHAAMCARAHWLAGPRHGCDPAGDAWGFN